MEIRPLAPADRSDWDALFAAYADFYNVTQTPQMRDTVWGWLHDPDHSTNCLIAEYDGKVVGFTHFRPFTSQLRAATNGFLDDLFVDPATRGTGAAQALINAVSAHGRANGWSTIRWITADDNYRARGVYDKLAKRTGWITYDIPL
jgi:GNAT superfamily N-acetyltransferase